MSPRHHRVLGEIALVALATTPALARQYVAVPAVEWSALVPYVRANVVPERKGTAFNVFVCVAHVDRTTVTPFDDERSDFTRVLLFDRLRHDRKLRRAIDDTIEAFRHRPSELSAEDYRERYWELLARNSDFLPRLRASFEQARLRGRLRCWGCDKEPSFAPRVRRWEHAERISTGRR
jgi:hypothetical protein